MTQSNQFRDSFTLEAWQRWEKIPKSAQKMFLDNVFCGTCSGSVTIVLETAVMKGENLILRGKCQHCGKDVCRLIEPEPD